MDKESQAKAMQAFSMTSDVSIYHLPHSKIVNNLSNTPCCINIIDTPGFGDTRGAVWDEKIKKMIIGLLKKLETLDYLCIVVKGSTNRLDIPSKFIYETISSLYACDVSDRVLGMITFSDDNSQQAESALSAAGVKLHQAFKFNNSAMFEFNPENTVNEEFFGRAINNYEDFCEYIKDQNKTPISMKLTRDVLYKRNLVYE